MKITQIVDCTPRQIYHIVRKTFYKKKLIKSTQQKSCIFVVSTGRVGTQTLAALLGLASDVFAYHEPRPKLYGLSKLAYQYSYLDNLLLNTVLCEAYTTAREELINYAFFCQKKYIETSPQNTFLMPTIMELFPNTKFIHLVRDPRYVIRSGMRRQWYDGNPYDKTRITPLSNSEDYYKWKKYNSFQKNIWLWNETNQWILNMFAQLQDNQKLMLKSEDLFDFNKETIEKMFAFVDTKIPEKKQIMSVFRKKLNKQQKGIFPEINAWSEEMNQEIKKIAGNTAIVLGYKL